MASSKVMWSSESRNSDLARLSSAKSQSISDLHNNNSNNHPQAKRRNSLGSMTLDGLLRNVYGDNTNSDSTLLDTEITLVDSEKNKSSINRQESFTSARKTVDDVWKEIVAGSSERKVCKQELPDEMMTLEDFLAKAGAVGEEEDVKVSVTPLPTKSASGGIYPFDMVPSSPYQSQEVEGSFIGFGNGGGAIGARGKRRAILEPLDKAAQQRQRRMIKNRESAARSRERKQAYQVELESLAVKLEEENEQLRREKVWRSKERFKQLMEKVVPVVEKRRPARVLRRVRSLQW